MSIKLRKAELKDFETIKTLYEDKTEEQSYQWLYDDTSVDDSKDVKMTEEEFRDFFEKYIGEYSAFLEELVYTMEKYQKDLNYSDTYIFKIQDHEGKILGYICIRKQYKKVYKIAEWALFNPKDEQLKTDVFEQLKKLKTPQMEILKVDTPSKSTAQWLLSNGFERSYSHSYEFQINKK